MGKSPGRWIKTVLFGKKQNAKRVEKVIKAREVSVATSAREAGEGSVVTSAPETELDLSLVVVSEPVARTHDRKEREEEEGTNSAPTILHNVDIPLADVGDMEVTRSISQSDDTEKIRQELAATKVQAACRGFLARRAFQALKGIIRLQALIRGHLVRRQAVATLSCMLGIVKLQALVRGREVRKSSIGLEAHKFCFLEGLQGQFVDQSGLNLSRQLAKLSPTVFINKLLASSPNVMPLHLHCDPDESNSVSKWLQRWSKSFFWKPCLQPRKTLKSQRKHGLTQVGEAETRKTKCSSQSTPTTATSDTVTNQTNSDVEKPKRVLRKVSTNSTDPVQESPTNEIEKVKRSLRKVQNPVLENTVQSEVEAEKLRASLERPLNGPRELLFERSRSSRGEVVKRQTILDSSDFLDAEKTPEPTKRDDKVDLSSGDQAALDFNPSAGTFVNEDENTPISNGNHEKVNFGDDKNRKSSRKSWVTPKPESTENNGLQLSSPAVPSYMAATESAKAKLRAQGSPRFGHDGSEKSNLSRRHSLPSSANGKTYSPSPRTQKANLSGGKGGNKSDKREPSAKAEWKR